DQRGVRRPGAVLPGPLRHRRRGPAGQPVGRRDRLRSPARVVGRAADDPAVASVRRAPRRALRHDDHVHRDRPGRDRHLGEPALQRQQRGGRQVISAEQAAQAFPDEVVTRAVTRLVSVPGLDKPVALITIDNGHDHTRPSTFGPQSLVSLAAAFDEAAASDPAAIAVTGKPFVFAVGADLSGVEQVSDPELARQIAQTGHDVFRKFTESPVPTFAFVNGAVMGGGLELALSCHYRTMADNVAAIALPEVFLGLFPGWGGTQLLPN